MSPRKLVSCVRQHRRVSSPPRTENRRTIRPVANWRGWSVQPCNWTATCSRGSRRPARTSPQAVASRFFPR